MCNHRRAIIVIEHEKEANRVHCVFNGVELFYQLEKSPMPLPPNGIPQKSGLAFSQIETAILKAATDQWQTAPQIAEKTGQSPSTWFRAILSNLVERQWLEGGRNGYRRSARLDYGFLG